MKSSHVTKIAILGAGPVGLAAAAHALEHGLIPVVLEAGAAAGHAIRQWGHVAMFSPWQSNIDRASARLLQARGWHAPALSTYPTGREFVSLYLEPLATQTAIKNHIRLNSQVTGISRSGFDKVMSHGREAAPFEIRYRDPTGSEMLLADAVIDASGTWFSRNPAGANGLAAIGEADNASSIAYAMPDVLGHDRQRYQGKRIAVLGAGHSALGTLIDLVRLRDQEPATEVIWLLRGADPQKAFGGGAHDKLAARGALGSLLASMIVENKLTTETGFSVARIDQRYGRLLVSTGHDGSARHVLVDELVVATGFRPDLTFLSEMRVALDPALECPLALGPLIDPNVHSCGTVRPHGARELSQPEAGFYIAGMKSYGRAPTFLMMTGYEQARSIIADIAGDKVAAGRVELKLPETGACSGPGIVEDKGCCERPAKSVISGIRLSSEGPKSKAQRDGERGDQSRHQTRVPATPIMDRRMTMTDPEYSASATDAGAPSIPHPQPAEACCRGPAKANPSACCDKDEIAKSEGKAGCGCNAERAQMEVEPRCCG